MLGPRSLPVLEVPTLFRATSLGFTGDGRVHRCSNCVVLRIGKEECSFNFQIESGRSDCDGGCYQ